MDASSLLSASKHLIFPAIVVGYITISGLTRSCPMCTSIVDTVLGRSKAKAATETKGDLSATSALSLEGEPVSFASFAGKPTLIDVWATWCGPCRKQRKILEELEQEMGEKINVVAVSVDDDPATVRAFLSEHQGVGTNLMATNELLTALGSVRSIPTLVIVDSEGRIQAINVGVQSAKSLHKQLAAMLQ